MEMLESLHELLLKHVLYHPKPRLAICQSIYAIDRFVVRVTIEKTTLFFKSCKYAWLFLVDSSIVVGILYSKQMTAI